MRCSRYGDGSQMHSRLNGEPLEEWIVLSTGAASDGGWRLWKGCGTQNEWVLNNRGLGRSVYMKVALGSRGIIAEAVRQYMNDINQLMGCAVKAASVPIRVGHFWPDINVHAISNFLLSSFVLDWKLKQSMI